MIAAISARLLVATLVLLALAASASAECAWVLWSAPGTKNPSLPHEQVATRIDVSGWTPRRGYETAKACAAAEGQAEQDEWKLAEHRNEGRVIWQMFVFACFPDTVDPRGPKGK